MLYRPENNSRASKVDAVWSKWIKRFSATKKIPVTLIASFQTGLMSLIADVIMVILWIAEAIEIAMPLILIVVITAPFYAVMGNIIGFLATLVGILILGYIRNKKSYGWDYKKYVPENMPYRQPTDVVTSIFEKNKR